MTKNSAYSKTKTLFIIFALILCISLPSFLFLTKIDFKVKATTYTGVSYNSETLTANDIIEISNLDELIYFVEYANMNPAFAGTARLTADIDFNPGLKIDLATGSYTGEVTRHWTTINSWNGIFDGQNHTIYGVFKSETDNYDAFAMFSMNYGTIKNLKIKNSIIQTGDRDSASTTLNKHGTICVLNTASGVIENVEVNARVAGINSVGGIVGTNSGVVDRCIMNGYVAGYVNIGGIAGLEVGYTSGVIINCINRAKVGTSGFSGNTKYTATNYAGISPNGKIINCLNEGEINSTPVATTTTRTACGIASSDSSNVPINCLNRGTISGGGNLYAVSANNENCFNIGGITGNLDTASTTAQSIEEVLKPLNDYTKTLLTTYPTIKEWKYDDIDEAITFGEDYVEPVFEDGELDLSGETVDSLTQKIDTAFQDIQNGSSATNPDLNNSLTNVDDTVKTEVTDKAQQKLDEINGAGLDVDEQKRQLKIVEIATSSAIIVSSNQKIKEENLAYQQEITSPEIPITSTISDFYQRQYDTLIALNTDVTTKRYDMAIELAEKVSDSMVDMSLRVKNCSGEKMVREVNNYVTNVSLKTFRDYDPITADKEYVEATYNAILVYLQEQTLAKLKITFEDAKYQARFDAQKLRTLEDSYKKESEAVGEVRFYK